MIQRRRKTHSKSATCVRDVTQKARVVPAREVIAAKKMTSVLKTMKSGLKASRRPDKART